MRVRLASLVQFPPRRHEPSVLGAPLAATESALAQGGRQQAELAAPLDRLRAAVYAERGPAGPLWAKTWTSGLVLAGLLARCPLHGVRVLELGSGLGLVAIVAARSGGRVTVNDRSPLALALTALNADENRVTVEKVPCEWRRPHALEVHGPWDLVLG